MQENVGFNELVEENFTQETSGKDKSVVIFTASWCTPCKMIKPMLPGLAEEHGAVPFWVDIEKNMDLARKFNVQAVPFIVTMKSGAVVDSIATNNLQKISEMVSRL